MIAILATIGSDLLRAVDKGIDDGVFKFVGQGTISKSSGAMNIFRGEGLTVLVKPGGEFVSVLKNVGTGLDKKIKMLP